MQDLGTIHQFSKNFESQSVSAVLLAELASKFDNFKFTLSLFTEDSVQNEEQNPSSLAAFHFRISPESEYVSLLLNAISNFISSHGFNHFLKTPAEELESFFRAENHRPVFDRPQLELLEQLKYSVALAYEQALAKQLFFAGKSQSANTGSLGLYKELQSIFNLYFGSVSSNIFILDFDTESVYYRWENWQQESDLPLMTNFWGAVLQRLADNYVENNARRWVDKPWQ